MADGESLESIGRRVYMDGGLLVVSAGGCSGKAAPGSDDDEVYCVSLVGASADPEWLRALHASIQLALMPEKAFVDLFLCRPLSDDVAALQASLQCTLSVLPSEVMDPDEEDVSWVETANRMSCRAGLLGSHLGWVSNVGTGIAGIESGANVVDAVARGLSSVAVVGSAFAVVSVLAKGVTLAGESAALKRDFQSLYKGLQETAKQLLGVIIRGVSRGLCDEKVVANMVGALAEAWSISQDLERRIWKRTLGSVLRGESAKDFRDELKSRHDALRILVASYHSDNAIRDTVDDILTRLEVALTRKYDPFVPVFRGFPCNLDVVEEALPGLVELKQSVLADSQIAVSGCRRQVLGTKGEGGVGKTTACFLLCNDPAVKERFPDGIHFLQFGLDSSDEQVLSLLCDTLESAGGKATSDSIRDTFKKHSGDSDPLGVGADGVRAYFAGKSVLFVCDNVSHRVNLGSKRRQPLARLLQSMVADAPQACLLLTTRYGDVARNIPKIIAFDRLDALDATQAAAGARVLIEKYADEDAADRGRSSVRQGEAREKLIAVCGGWQLLLCVCGRMVRESDGDWAKISERVENDKGLLLRARPDEEDADPALGAVLTSSLGLLDAAPARKSRAGISISAIRGEFGERCFEHLYSVFGILRDLRYVPCRLLQALFAAVRTLAKKKSRLADPDTGSKTSFEDVCLAACQFLELYGLVDLVRNEGDYAVRLHDSKFHFCEDLFNRNDLWTSVNPCRVHYEFLREMALRGTSGSTSLGNVDWASICDAVAGPDGKTRLGWEPNLVHHLVTAAGAYMELNAAHSSATTGCSDVAAATGIETYCGRVALGAIAEDTMHVSEECTTAMGNDNGNEYSEEAFEWLMGLVCDFRWVRARAILDGRRGVLQDLLTVFSGICKAYRCRDQRDGVVEARDLDPFCDNDVDSSYHLKGELAALKIVRWMIVAADEGCIRVLAQQCAAHKMGGNVMCSELLGKCFGFESLKMWRRLSDAARERGHARARQFFESAETNVKGPWWKPVVGGDIERAVLLQTGERFVIADDEYVFGLGKHCGLVTMDETDCNALKLSDDIDGYQENNRVAVPTGLNVVCSCVVQGEADDDGDVIAVVDEGGCVFLWNVRRTGSGLDVRLVAEVNAGGSDVDAKTLEGVCGLSVGCGGKVVAVHIWEEVFVWAEGQGDGGGAHVFRGALEMGETDTVREVDMAKNGGVIVVNRLVQSYPKVAVTCFKDAGDGEFSDAWTIERDKDSGERVTQVAVTADSSCVYTLTYGGLLSRVDVASGIESALGKFDKAGNSLVFLEHGPRWRILGSHGEDIEWWTDGGASAGAGAVRGWQGWLAREESCDMLPRWAGGGAGRVFETFTSVWNDVWRIRRWRVGANGRVSPADGAPTRDAPPSDDWDDLKPYQRRSSERSFAIRHACAEAVVAGEEGVWVWDVRTGARTCRLTDEESDAVDVSVDGSIAATARWKGFVDVWDLRSRRRLVVLAGNGVPVSSLLLCDGGDSDGRGGGGGGSDGGSRRAGRLWVVVGGSEGVLRVGDCRRGHWLHELKLGWNPIHSLGCAMAQPCARHQHERTASAYTPVAPEVGAAPVMHAWIASREEKNTFLCQLSSDGKLIKNLTQPARHAQREHAFADVFDSDELRIQGWRQVSNGFAMIAVARDADNARFVGPVRASYSCSGSCWRVAHNGHISLAGCSCPPVVLNNTTRSFEFVNMPRVGDESGGSDLAAVTIGARSGLQIWHLKLGGG